MKSVPIAGITNIDFCDKGIVVLGQSEIGICKCRITQTASEATTSL